MIQIPLRLRLAGMAGTQFMNSRFGSEQYFPAEFSRGVKHAVPVLFDLLSGWDGNLSPNQASKAGRQLDSLVAPDLLYAFSQCHQALHQAGLVLELQWRWMRFSEIRDDTDGRESSVTPKFVWLTFGEPNDATSSLLKGPVSIWQNYNLFQRRVWNDEVEDHELPILKQRRVQREICFEYVYRLGDIMEKAEYDDDGDLRERWLGFAQKRRMMDIGQRIAIDCEARGGGVLEYHLSRMSDGSTVQKGEVDYGTIGNQKGLAIRMESSHFDDEFCELDTWRIADVDNFLIYPRLVEEEAGIESTK